MKNSYSILLVIFILISCATRPEIVVDLKQIQDKAKYEKDKKECVQTAMNFKRTRKEAGAVAIGAGAAGVATAGVATIVAGAIFWPAIPFIVGATVLGAGAGGGVSSSKTEDYRQKIAHKCMEERGYKPLF